LLSSVRATAGAGSLLEAPAAASLRSLGSLLDGGASLALLSLRPASLAPLNFRINEGGLAILLPLPVRKRPYVIYALSFLSRRAAS